jgi:hypothetical protein
MCLLTARGLTLARRSRTWLEDFGSRTWVLATAGCNAMCGAPVRGMKLERMERIARGRRDKETQPGALRPYRELSLPMIAGMAYSTLKSGGATHDCVAFGHLLKIHVNDPIHANDTGRTAHKWPVPNWDSPTGTPNWATDPRPVVLQCGIGGTDARSAADGDGRGRR